ncbi:uncharacterized protein LOC126739910 [Anthonomus grandis grandis]|uniref:uncharacterized protein LOC126739910 n=1 Tax=Anthonomus grandis grandis TaxID=2921223 RepID=UPI002166B18C|nr:uncharacterized protein LOC126739910 [Anthonomus grandis grandis]XP_050301694.1 uncharacterized protein LOC126739910 [Anthonomus grandis grandis]
MSLSAKEELLDRPHSYPPLIQANGKYHTNGNNNGSTQNKLNERSLSPSQALCLTTTVPQNFASRSLGDKHAPTRNSLRHSRMIVMYRNGKIPKKYLPFVIKHYRLVKSMKVLTIIIGILMSLVSVCMVLWSPTLDKLYLPYWSAAPVFCSGVVGCFFLGFCPRPYPGRSLGCHYHFTKVISLLTTSISCMACIVVLGISIVHLAYLHTATCTPNDKLNQTCLCVMPNSTHIFNDNYLYAELTCEEVDCFLRGVLATSCVLNVLAFVLEVMYLCAQWRSRTKFVYAKVPIREDSVRRSADER